jgi:hypothetical protein
MERFIESGNLTFGTDPEVGATYLKDGKKYVQPAPFFRLELGVETQKTNTKHPVYYSQFGCEVIEDGVAFEFIVPPTRDPEVMFEHIEHCWSRLGDLLSKEGYTAATEPALNYEVERFLDVPDEYKMCLVFGCDPDKDAILPNYVCDTIDALRHPYRYFGGHFQIGCVDPRGRKLIQMHYAPFIQLCSIFIGNLVMSKARHVELEQIRAQLYGQPGRYRIQPHGIEYRTPSNSWIHNQRTIAAMFRGAKRAFELLQNPKKGKEVIGEYLPATITALSTANPQLAHSVLEKVREDYGF